MGVDSFIPWLLYSSLLGSMLVGLILFIRWVCKNRIGANWQYLLWFLLILKLLIPYAPESSLSLFNTLQYLTNQNLDANYLETQGNGKVNQGIERNLSISQLVHATYDYSLSVNRKFFESGDIVLLGVWLLGVVSLSIYLVNTSLRLKGIIKNSSRVNDNCIISLLEECKQTINSKANPVLVESAVIRSPMVVGPIRPYIILPTSIINNFSKAELRFILLHELAHLQRRDLYINWVTSFLQIIHWFNPLIWYAFYQMRQDRELACDAYVLSVLRPDEYKSYGAAIISFLESYSSPTYDYTIVGLASDKAHLKKRMKMIASYKKENIVGIIWGVVFFLLLGCLVLTNAKGTTAAVPSEKSPKPNQSINYEDLSNYFQGYEGTFVLLDLAKEHYQVYNDDHSRKRVSPDSTYKIISALVGLEQGVLNDENTQLKWDRILYPIEPWNGDQTLGSAMAYSVNWYFQQVDSRVGRAKIEDYLKQISYGNHDLSGGLNDFWVESSLKISPLEQVEVLKKLYTYEMPFSRRNIDIVKKVLKISEQNQVVLAGKTGTGAVNNNSINGWFIGYVNKNGQVYVFATNIQGKEGADGARAKKITLAILKDKNIL